MGESDFAQSSSADPESEPDNTASFAVNSLRTPQRNLLLCDLQAPTPLLHNSHSELLNGQQTTIELADFKANLLQQREWIMAELQNKAHPTDPFETFQSAGNQVKADLIFTRSGQPSHSGTGTFTSVWPLGLNPGTFTPVWPLDLDPRAIGNQTDTWPQLQRASALPKLDDDVSGTASNPKRSKTTQEDPLPPRHNPSRTAKNVANSRVLAQAAPPPSVHEDDEDLVFIPMKAPVPVTPPPQYSAAPHTPRARAELATYAVSNAIMDYCRNHSRLPLMRPDDSDPFYRFFNKRFSHPPNNQPLVMSLSESVKAAWDDALPGATWPGYVQAGMDAYILFFRWYTAVRSDSRWLPSNSMNMIDRLEAIRDVLQSNSIPLGSGPSVPISNPTPSPFVTSTLTSTSVLSADPSVPATLPSNPSEPATLTSNPSEPATSTSNPSEPATSTASTSVTQSVPRGPTQFPLTLELVVSAIETLALHDSSIPSGEPDGDFHGFFRPAFSAPAPGTVWPQLEVYLDARIGTEVLVQTLRHGRYGIDGLIRHWLVRSRASPGWDTQCDEGVESKLHAVLKVMDGACLQESQPFIRAPTPVFPSRPPTPRLASPSDPIPPVSSREPDSQPEIPPAPLSQAVPTPPVSSRVPTPPAPLSVAGSRCPTPGPSALPAAAPQVPSRVPTPPAAAAQVPSRDPTPRPLTPSATSPQVSSRVPTPPASAPQAFGSSSGCTSSALSSANSSSGCTSMPTPPVSSRVPTPPAPLSVAGSRCPTPGPSALPAAAPQVPSRVPTPPAAAAQVPSRDPTPRPLTPSATSPQVSSRVPTPPASAPQVSSRAPTPRPASPDATLPVEGLSSPKDQPSTTTLSSTALTKVVIDPSLAPIELPPQLETLGAREDLATNSPPVVRKKKQHALPKSQPFVEDSPHVASAHESGTTEPPAIPQSNPPDSSTDLPSSNGAVTSNLNTTSASSSKQPQITPIPPGGVPIPVNADVRQIPTPSPPSGLWKVDKPSLFEVTSASVRRNQVVSADVPQIYESILNLLLQRREGESFPEGGAVMEVGESFGPKPSLAVRDWIARKPNISLVQSDGEAPWHRPDIFDLTITGNSLPSTPDDKRHTTFTRNILAIFYNIGSKRLAQGVRTIVAAVTYASMDTPELTLPQDFSEANIPNQAVRSSLLAALHFQKLQEDPKRILNISDCVITMSHMVNRLYSILEAIVSVRAKFFHTMQVVSTAPAGTHDHLNAEYECLTKKLGAGTIPNPVIGALTAFIVGGVKGLMTYPTDANRYGAVKLTHFIVLVDKLQGGKKLEEPIWKYTQKYILDTIEEALFPQGFEKARRDLDSGIYDDSWDHTDFSKMNLGKAMELEFFAFCTNRSLFPGGDSYKAPLFELPDIPAAKVPEVTE
ncbi:uncharacterized protein MELLADRAFT_92226 [Melampsora larici-populina 98AG31]|uniref:Uncharacterized protein n=1 Tax=Melampsora larici-populina (strain 98AG31 / pathotype 3-4-7) TaxID=747676 RepID=F4R8W2_MELLP|nr:uncharacterized protein MELLADRAFT_92226 [Melampsora larici-populina 98AG31]EGG11260.1 hypothetical protein MELLADRAFT_92226 [Melampsora larici-populina 98AG31]